MGGMRSSYVGHTWLSGCEKVIFQTFPKTLSELTLSGLLDLKVTVMSLEVLGCRCPNRGGKGQSGNGRGPLEFDHRVSRVICKGEGDLACLSHHAASQSRGGSHK